SGHLLYCVHSLYNPCNVRSLWSSPVLCPQSWSSPVKCPQSLVISCKMSAVLVISCTVLQKTLVISCTFAVHTGQIASPVRVRSLCQSSLIIESCKRCYLFFSDCIRQKLLISLHYCTSFFF
ncbi:unnamed protein product, partial [Staurois parvus]